MAGCHRTEMSARDTWPKIVRITQALVTQNIQYIYVHRVQKKRGHVIFDYNSRLLVDFYIFFPLETGMNTAQLHVIYLLNGLMTSWL